MVQHCAQQDMVTKNIHTLITIMFRTSKITERRRGYKAFKESKNKVNWNSQGSGVQTILAWVGNGYFLEQYNVCNIPADHDFKPLHITPPPPQRTVPKLIANFNFAIFMDKIFRPLDPYALQNNATNFIFCFFCF